MARLALQSSQNPRRDPVTIDHLRALHHHLNHTNAFDIAVFMIVCITFWSCCRLGELLIDMKPLRCTYCDPVMSECTALLSQKSGFGGVSESGFSLCAVPTYYCGSEYFYNQHPQVQNLIGTECSLNRSERRVKSKAS